MLVVSDGGGDGSEDDDGIADGEDEDGSDGARGKMTGSVVVVMLMVRIGKVRRIVAVMVMPQWRQQ